LVITQEDTSWLIQATECCHVSKIKELSGLQKRRSETQTGNDKQYLIAPEKLCNWDFITMLRQIFDRKITWKMTIWKTEENMGVYYKDVSYRDNMTLKM